MYLLFQFSSCVVEELYMLNMSFADSLVFLYLSSGRSNSITFALYRNRTKFDATPLENVRIASAKL